MAALLSLSSLMNLTALEAVALPAVLDNASAKARMSRAALVDACITNAPLRDYLAGACRQAVAAL